MPTFEVDPLWPKPLPNHWVLGQTIGVAVDGRDHIWIVHRGDASLNIMTEATNTAGLDGGSVRPADGTIPANRGTVQER